MAYDDDEDTYYEEPEVEAQPAPEPYVPPAPEPEPEPEPEPPPEPTAKKWRPYVDPDEEPPPLAPEEPRPQRYAQAQIASTGVDASPEPAPAPAPAPAPEPAPAKKWRPYVDPDEPAPVAATADGKKWRAYEEPEGAWATFGRELLHGAPAAVTGAVTGAGTGAALGAAGFNPVTVFGGALVGGIAGGVTADVAKDKLLKAGGVDDDAVRRANERENPWAYRAGSFLSQAFGGSAKAKAVERVLSGGIAGGWEAGSQLVQGKPLNFADIATQTAGGATFAGNARPWIRKAEEVGGKVGARFKPEAPPPPPEPPIQGPAQGALPFPTQAPPYQPKLGATAQEAQIGGGERQLGLPLDQPAPPPARPGVTTQPELGLEPPPVVDSQGQLGFSINAPHPDSRYTYTPPSMPSGAGTAREAAPPPRAKEPDPQPHSAVREGMAQEAIGVTPQASAGIHVLQPGQQDPTVVAGLKARTDPAYPAPPRTTFEPSRPPEQGPPAPPSGEIIPPNRALVPRPAEGTQGVAEPPVPDNHTRLYQGENHPPNVFTTDRAEAARFGAVKSVDVSTKGALPFFTPTNQPGTFTTRNERYQQQLRPVQEIRTEPTGKGPQPPEPPAGAAPPPAGPPAGAAPPPAPPPPGGGTPAPAVKVASPALEAKIQQAIAPPAAAPAALAVPPKTAAAIATSKAAAPAVLPKAAAAVATSKAAQVGAPKEIVLAEFPGGSKDKGKIISSTTLTEALAQHGTRKGLIGRVTNFVRKAMLETIGDMPVHIQSRAEFIKHTPGNVAALYNRQQNHIVVNAEHLTNKKTMAHAILHEGIHGVTAHAIAHNPAVRAIARAIMNDVHAAEIKRLGALGATHLEKGTSYGFKNEREFIAEAFSSPAFQKMLSNLTLSPKAAKALRDFTGSTSPIKSAWDALVQSVRKLLGIPPGQTNALEAAMRVTEHAMTVNEATKAKFMALPTHRQFIENVDLAPPTVRDITDPMAVPGKVTVTARDKFGNEIGFTGQTVHAAAAYAKAAGYKQIFNPDGSPYVAPKAAATPAAAAVPAPAAAKQTPSGGGGAGKPPVSNKPASSVEAAEKSILSRIAEKPPWYSKFPTTKEEAKKLWREGYTAIKNAMDPIEQIKKQNAEGASLTPEQDFAMLARLTKGLGGRLQQMIRNGTYDITTGKVNGKGLDEIIKPIEANPDGFTAYALAKRVIELEGRGIETGMNVAEARQVAAARNAQWEPTFRELVGFQDRVLENLVRTGVISQKAAAQMRQLNKEYVPFYRALDPKSELGIQLGSGLQTRNPIFKIKGSDKEIFDPIDSIIKNTYVFTDLAHRNQALVAMKRFNDTLPEDRKFMKRDRSSHPIEVKETELQAWMDKHGIEGFADDTLTIFRPNAFKPADDKIRLFNNGKSEVYTVSPDVGKAVNAMDQQSQDLWVKIVATPARMLRAGAVLSPEFMLRNPLRDMLTAFIQAKHGSVPVYDFYVGLKEIFKNSKDYQEWLIGGGANANLVSMDRDILKTNARTLDNVANVIKDPRQWLEPLRKLSELSENATRVGMYKRAREKGVHQLEAAFEARQGTLDFQRIGAHGAVRAANAMIPFLNVHLEGMDQAARAFKADPTGFLAKVGVGITLPSVLLWFRNKDDERVQQLPAWQRDLFWIVTTDDWKPISTAERDRLFANMEKQVGRLDVSKLKNTFRQTADGSWEYNNGTIYRIPKPFELGVIFGSIPERLLDAYFQTKPEAFKGLQKTMERALVPNYVPQIALPFMEQWANRSLFLDRNLLTEQQIKLPPAQQYGPYTSETAKVLGSVIRGVAGDKSSFGSPIIIDNYIRQWTGGLGKHVTDLIDAGIKTQQDRAPAPDMSPADMPGYKAFVARFPDRGAQAIQDFYDHRNDRKMEQAGIKELTKTDPKGADARIRAAGGESYVGDDFAKLLKADRDTVTQIMQDKKMSPADKRAAIDLTYLLMIEHAKQGVKLMEQTKRKAAP